MNLADQLLPYLRASGWTVQPDPDWPDRVRLSHESGLYFAVPRESEYTTTLHDALLWLVVDAFRTAVEAGVTGSVGLTIANDSGIEQYPVAFRDTRPHLFYARPETWTAEVTA